MGGGDRRCLRSDSLRLRWQAHPPKKAGCARVLFEDPDKIGGAPADRPYCPGHQLRPLRYRPASLAAARMDAVSRAVRTEHRGILRDPRMLWAKGFGWGRRCRLCSHYAFAEVTRSTRQMTGRHVRCFPCSDDPVPRGRCWQASSARVRVRCLVPTLDGTAHSIDLEGRFGCCRSAVGEVCFLCDRR